MAQEPGAGSIHTIVRRRPTRRHRRNRRIRRALLLVVLVSTGLGVSSLILGHLSPSIFRASRSVPPSWDAVEASRNRVLEAVQDALRPAQNRPVYPYSIVPGGVEDARELKWVAEHDPVVASHYAGFDYNHAKVVRLVLARTVYLSYRIGNRVYWTRHRVTLKKGEKVITDGKMTARARCANRVEEVPQQATLASEPVPAKFEVPIPPAGTALANPPVPFQSSLLNHPAMPGLEPVGQLSLYYPLAGGAWVPIFPPPLPGVCGPVKKKPTGGGAAEFIAALSANDAGKGKKKPVNPCGSGGGGGGGGGGTVPEPGTWVLVSSGLAAIYWQARRKFVRV